MLVIGMKSDKPFPPPSDEERVRISVRVLALGGVEHALLFFPKRTAAANISQVWAYESLEDAAEEIWEFVFSAGET